MLEFPSSLHVLPGYRINDPTSQATERLALFKKWMLQAEAFDVVVVMSAGNEGLDGDTLGMIVPQNQGTPTNGIITVGGVYNDGSLWPPTVPETRADQTTQENPLTGSMTCYAQADAVSSFDGSLKSTTSDGTSYAAPIVVSPYPRHQNAFSSELSECQVLQLHALPKNNN
jgi:hypothetical protein